MKSRYMMHCSGFMQSNGRSWLPFFTVLLFGMLVSLAVVRFVYFRADSDMLIAQEVKNIANIMERIHADCHIIGFDNQKTILDFLTVGSFVGSEVGGVNLTYPSNWKGPYVNVNPSIQGIEFQIVSTKDGYFVTPGDGVVLGNGKTIGKDIILDEKADINAMMQDPQALRSHDKAMAAPLSIRRGILQDILYENILQAGNDA